MPLSIQKRLEEFYRRLSAQPPSVAADQALERIGKTLEEVEDQHSGVLKKDPPPPPNRPDGRMYSPKTDRIIRHPDGRITAAARRHTIDIGNQGTITTRRATTGTVEFYQAGGGP